MGVRYFHVVFTLPAPVGDIAYYNKAVIYGLLFDVAADAADGRAPAFGAQLAQQSVWAGLLKPPYCVSSMFRPESVEHLPATVPPRRSSNYLDQATEPPRLGAHELQGAHHGREAFGTLVGRVHQVRTDR
jgi:hypothetical protein